MRRLLSLIAVACVSLLAAAPAASAAPEVKFKVTPLPIPGYPGTGYRLGAGAALEAEYRISGTEYGGFPAPLIGVVFYLPPGTHIHPAGFPTCPDALILTEKEPHRCPAGSRAGTGTVQGIVAFGHTRVPEEGDSRILLLAGRRAEFLHVRARPRVPGNPVHGEVREPRGCRRERPRTDLPGAARGNGPGSPRRLGSEDQHQGRRCAGQGQARDLLRHGAVEMPEGRIHRQDSADVRGARGTQPADGDRAVHGAVPAPLTAYRMFTARETISPIVTSETSDCAPITLFAIGVSGIVSVGENAVALVSETYR